MDEQTTQPAATAPIYQQSQEKNAKWLWLLIILIIVGALVFAFFRGIGPFASISPFVKEKEEITSPSPQAFSLPVNEVSPSPETQVDRAEPAIRVLNGSGVAGIATSVKDFLEDLGWRVTSVGNAASYDFAQTEVRLKRDFSDWEETLVSDLSDKYSVTASQDELDASDSADIEVIVGAK